MVHAKSGLKAEGPKVSVTWWSTLKYARDQYERSGVARLRVFVGVARDQYDMPESFEMDYKTIPACLRDRSLPFWYGLVVLANRRASDVQ